MIRMALSAAFALIATPAAAAEVYSSQQSFEADAGKTSSYDFNDVTTPLPFSPSSLTYRGLTFSVDQPGYNANSNSLTGTSTEFEFYSVDQTSFVAIDLVGGATFTLAFGLPTTAFGASFVGFANAGRTESVALIGADQSVIQSFTFNGPDGVGDNRDFIGFISQTPFSAITFTHQSRMINDFIGMDNALVGASAGAVPEPSTWALMIVGFGAIGGSMRYRSKQRSLATQS